MKTEVIGMALRRVSMSTEAELQAILGRNRLALTEVGGRRVLLQVIEDELDLRRFPGEQPRGPSAVGSGYSCYEPVTSSIMRRLSGPAGTGSVARTGADDFISAAEQYLAAEPDNPQ